jgi:hypothetical protein
MLEPYPLHSLPLAMLNGMPALLHEFIEILGADANCAATRPHAMAGERAALDQLIDRRRRDVERPCYFGNAE